MPQESARTQITHVRGRAFKMLGRGLGGEGFIGHDALPMNQSRRRMISSNDMALIRLLSWSTDFTGL
jgi:hypothetical protein